MYVTRNKVGLILVITFALLLTVLVGHSKSKELMKKYKHWGSRRFTYARFYFYLNKYKNNQNIWCAY